MARPPTPVDVEIEVVTLPTTWARVHDDAVTGLSAAMRSW